MAVALFVWVFEERDLWYSLVCQEMKDIFFTADGVIQL